MVRMETARIDPASHDAQVLAVLRRRDGEPTLVDLEHGRTVLVFSISWGYDRDEVVALVTTNTVPDHEDAELAAFETTEVVALRDPEVPEVDLLGLHRSAAPTPHERRRSIAPDAEETARIDRWLWAVRLAKTRSEATALVRAGHVRIDGRPAKASSPVRVGDRVTARVHGVDRDVEVARVIEKRVGAAIASECLVDHTPPPPPSDPSVAVLFGERDRGTGRPTKRDRRQIDRIRRG
jgi:ribosome-associated heat shock protein Hsp15